MDLGRGLALLTFAIIVVVNLYFLNTSQLLYQGVSQLRGIGSSFHNPSLKLYYSTSNAIICVQNPNDFNLTIINITGEFSYLPKEVVVYPHSAENLSLEVTNYKTFTEEVGSGNYNLSVDMSFLGINVTFHEVI